MSLQVAIHPAIWTGNFSADGLGSALDKAATIGFSHVVVPLRNFEVIDPAAMARAFASRGLRPVNTAGVGLDSDVGSADQVVQQRGKDRLRRAIAMARDMGSGQINGVLYAPLMKASGPPAPGQLQRSAEILGELAREAQSAGVRLAIELVNRYETNLLNTVEQGMDYLKLAGEHPNLTLHLDTFHMAIEEADLDAAIDVALPKIGYFELDQSHRGALTEGSLDLSGFIKRLAHKGYSGMFGIEAFARGPMAPDHADALAIWRDPFADPDKLAREGFALIKAMFKN
jgi:D-psicose/D-tagatose/L-ribulose 3-epimerase